MQGFIDYYRILQVHHLAEPEVIEGAYKKLVKKYHPDISASGDCETKMRKINEAYEILKDADKRKSYDADWLKRQENTVSVKRNVREEIREEQVIPAKIVLARYFDCIKNKNFESAYAQIANADKNKVSLDDFLLWQTGVSKIYRLQNYQFTASKIEQNVFLDGKIYKQSVELVVKTVEHNMVMGRIEKDIINKKVVQEKEGWRVYLGYQDIAAHIAEFEKLNDLLVAKSVINEIVELNHNKDRLTGLPNKKGFIEAADKEIWRHDRYGNKFSLMLLQIDFPQNILHNKRQAFKNYTIEWASHVLKNSFRKLDLIGRWGDTGFIVMMPETDLPHGLKAALKIKKVFEYKKMIYNNKFYEVTVKAGLDEYKVSLEYTVGVLNHYIALADKRKGSAVAHPYGIYE